MQALGGMQNPRLRGAYRGLVGQRTAPTLRQILSAEFAEKLLDKPELSDPLVE